MTDRSVVVRLKADIAGFKAQMASAAASVRDVSDRMTAADKSGTQFRKGLDTFGGAAGKIGLVAAAGLGAAVIKAANFDQAMSQVAAATRESAGSMDRLRDAALEAGAQTVFSASEAAQGIEALAKAGVSTEHVLSGGLAGALDLAAAGGQSVSEAAESAATAMTQFGLSGKDVPHIADLLAAAAGKAQGEVSDMSAALNQAGLVANQMGLSIEDTTGTLAAFASAGLVGSDAGTAFKSMIQRLQNPIGQGAKAMERLGLTAYDAQGNFVGITSVAGQLQERLAGLTQAQRDAALAQIFGSDAVRAASVLYQQGASGIQGWIDKTNDSGYAAETAATKLDNLKGDLEALGGSLETALIGTGSGSQGPLRGVVQSLTDVVNAYNKLPASAQSAAAGTLGVVAAVGGGVFVFSKLVQGVASTREAMSQLGVDAGRTGSIMRSALNVTMVLAGLQILDDALDQVFDKNLDGSKLSRSLDALAAGNVTGELADKFGKDLQDFGTQMSFATGNTNALNRTLGKIPLVGGFLSGDFLPKDVETGVQNIKAIDEALAGMVESGQQVEAAAVFDVLASKARDAGVSAGDISEGFAQYQLAVKNAAGEATSATSAQSGLASATGAAAAGMDAITGSTDAATQATEQFNAAVDQLNAVLEGRAGLRDYEAALDDFTASIKENGKSFDISTEKGRANQAALDNIASSAIKVAETMEGTARQTFLSGAIGDIRTLGRQMGVPKAEITALIQLLKQANDTDASPEVQVPGAEDSARRVKELDNRIKGLRGKIVEAKEKGASESSKRVRDLRAQIAVLKGKKLDILANTQPARSAANSLVGYINSLSATVEVRGRKTGGLSSLLTPADGATVPGQRLPYGDKIPALLAPGEEVISNRFGQADRHRALLKAINAGRMAGGGTVGRSVTAAAPSVRVGGAQVRVFIDGNEVRAIVDDRVDNAINAENAYQQNLARTNR